MSKFALDREEGVRLYTQVLTRSDFVPIRFRYGGKLYEGLGELKQISRRERNGGGSTISPPASTISRNSAS